MKPSLASFAQYFRIGLEVGLCEAEEAMEWAISVIDQMDEPPGEVIEVSWRKPLAHAISDLNEVEGEPEMALVCRWLLGRISMTLDSTNDSLGGAIRQAMRVARATGDAELYHIFDTIEDELYLAENETYGTVAECRKDFDKALKENGAPPFSLHLI
ncbi:hypothetical protein QPK31_16120 [Massilia sp. YIM B02769]|uniref:hypothetical protein n=1 Tax=Massilia sp. YIM B02769 TaxID=3050129 RepID=UPI0025B6AE1F|nr:hypothetical protein [Massilia sp. YIM B02769]MDN4059752.1 hypothetical protein [Massilia sp. YIM B02769]